MKLGYLVLSLLFFCFAGFFFRQNNVHIHFVDEEENIVLASYMNKGEKLYSDIFVQHQPLAYIISGFIQKVDNPKSIYELISSHRDFIILWSFLWSLVLVFSFGLPTLLTVVAIEMSKIYLFGNLFLAESLVFYPLIFLVGTLLTEIKLKKSNGVFLGLAWGVSLLLLLPVWPLLLILLIMFLGRKEFRSHLIYFFVGVTIVLIFTIPFISLPAYFYDVFLVNFKYYIPLARELSFRNIQISFLPYISIFFAPGENTKLLEIQRVFSFSYLVANVYLIQKKRYKLLLVAFLILGLSNLRYVAAGLQFYQGFHSLVWFSIFIFITGYLILQCFKVGNRIIRCSVSILMGLLLFITFFLTKDQLFVRRDKDRDYYVNYSRQFSFGEAIRIMSADNDRLFVVPDEFLIYWQAGIEHASKYIFFYKWMEDVPPIQSEIVGMFRSGTPTFVYCRDCNSSKMESLLSGYQRVKKGRSDTDLYVRSAKISKLDNAQIEKLSYLDYEI